MKHVLIAPLRVPVSKRKFISLNENVYRNAHYQTLAKMKREYSSLMHDQVITLPKMEKAKLTYRLFPGSGRRMDLSNVCAVADKFTLDCLVEAGKLPDDDWAHVPEVRFLMGQVDKARPRIEIEIEEIKAYADDTDGE